jgi:hypothetical protein
VPQTEALLHKGHKILRFKKAVSPRLTTAAARVRSQAKSCGICGVQSGTEAGFLEVLQFPLPILIPSNAPYSSIIRGWYNGPIRGRRTKRTQSHPIPWNFKKTYHLTNSASRLRAFAQPQAIFQVQFVERHLIGWTRNRCERADILSRFLTATTYYPMSESPNKTCPV